MLFFAFIALAQSPNNEVDATPAPVTEWGELAFDIRMPAEVELDGRTLFKAYDSGRFQTRAGVGDHRLRVYMNGKPKTLDFEVTTVARTQIMIGKTGLSASNELLDLPDADGVAKVEFRTVGREELTLVIEGQRTNLLAGKRQVIELPVGDHNLILRNRKGTVIWARGTLSLTRAESIVVQVSEGRMPEVSGPGSSFHSR